MRRAVVCLGDLSLGITLRSPMRVGSFLAPGVAVQTRQILGRRCLNAAFPGQR